MTSNQKAKKSGIDYEIMVSEVAKGLYGSHYTVEQGQWVEGVDGILNLDVIITGNVNGQPQRTLIECKDHDPARGRIGINVIREMDSKREEWKIDEAMICSNAGFTAGAIRKARRVGIGLIGVLREGDSRIRFALKDEVCFRKVRIESLKISLFDQENKELFIRDFGGQITYHGLPIERWFEMRANFFIIHNTITQGKFALQYHLRNSVAFDSPAGKLNVSWMQVVVSLSGAWYSKQVTIDATQGFYDWLRKRIRPASIVCRISVAGMDFDGGELMEHPTESDIAYGKYDELWLLPLLAIDGVHANAPFPNIDPLIVPADLNDQIKPENSKSLSEVAPQI